MRSRDLAGKIICSGVGGLIGFQSFINISVATNMLPNTGVPLPFISYGLTSLVSLYIGIGFVLNVGLQQKNINKGVNAMNIGLVAHDSKKTLMQNFCIAYRGILSKHELYATGYNRKTHRRGNESECSQISGWPCLVERNSSEAQIAQNDIDALIF